MSCATPWDLTLTFMLCIAFGLFSGVMLGIGWPRKGKS